MPPRQQARINGTGAAPPTSSHDLAAPPHQDVAVASTATSPVGTPGQPQQHPQGAHAAAYYAQMMQQGYAGYPPPFAIPPGYPYPFPPAAPAPAPASSSKRIKSDDEDDGTEEGDGQGGKRKKRLPLSCGECQRRKIKCDRKGPPCSSCVKRKRTAFCSFDDEDPVTPYASNSEVRALSRRLLHLETLFAQQFPSDPSLAASISSHPTLAHASPAASQHSHSHSHSASLASPPLPSHLSTASLQPNSGKASSGAAAAGADEDMQRSQSDTEDAVADLEEKTFEARVPVLQALQAAAANTVKRYNYVKVGDMELTSALTSILAEPLSFDQDGRPRSAARLGLDLAVAPADLPAVRNEALSQIYAVLPDTEIALYLIRKYFEEMEWDFRVLDPVAFPVEYERFVQMRKAGRGDLIDPLWVACFCMLLALSLDGFWTRPSSPMRDLSIFGGMPESDLRELPSVWHDAALRALQLGEWGGTPRVRTIQCVILMQQYIQLSSSSGQTGRILSWVASAIRVAQRLGLHRLGSNPQTMPPDDPALPPGSNSVKRETAVRLWRHLVNIDSWLSDSPSLRCYLLHPSQYNTGLPLNLNFSDLSRTDWRTPAPQPLTVYTDTSFELVQSKITEQIRRALDTLVLSDAPFSYPAVLEQHQALRSVFENVPEVFSENPVQIDSPRIAYQRACLHEDIHSRIVRLHRPLLARGYAPSSPFRTSTTACIDAAKALILGNLELLPIETSRWWMYSSTLASSFVVMLDVFHGLDTDAPGEEIKEKREILMKARTIFESQVATPALTVVVEEGRKILAALFVEEERRRTTKAAHSMASAPQPQLETFAQVLKRVSRTVAAQDALVPLAVPQPGATPFPPSSAAPIPNPALAPAIAPFSFAQAAATAMANTPTHFPSPSLPTTGLHPPPPGAFFGSDALPLGGVDGGVGGDWGAGSFFNGMAESSDWLTGGFGESPGAAGRDESALMDQLAATW
ncbi:hypothetical protein JCM8097_003955 [Rhodosporidiobolus ruineniae]